MPQIEIKGFEEMLEFIETLPENFKEMMREKLDGQKLMEKKFLRKLQKFVNNFDADCPIENLICNICSEVIKLTDVYIKAEIAKNLTFEGVASGFAAARALRSIADDIHQSSMEAEKCIKEKDFNNTH